MKSLKNASGVDIVVFDVCITTKKCIYMFNNKCKALLQEFCDVYANISDFLKKVEALKFLNI